MMNLRNPFCQQGAVAAPLFIGRFANLERIRTAVTALIDNGTLFNLAITGLPKIGKTSLVKKAIIERKDELIKNNILPINVNLGRCQAGENSFLDFLCVVLTTCFDRMEELGWVTPEIQGLYDSIPKLYDEKVDKHLIQVQLEELIENFFRKVSEANRRILLIVDEFDAARRLFRGAAPFHFLRDLVGSAEAELHILLTSRRNIAKIELQAGSDFVYFYNDLDVVNLGMFGEGDLDIYFSKFTDIRIRYSENFRKRLLWWCGAHPYLLGKFGWEVAEMCRTNEKATVNETDVDTVGAKIEDSVLKNYYKKNLMPLLQDLEIHGNLFQTLFEVKSVRTEEEEEAIGALEGYGLIKKTKNGGYTAYSEHFYNYLSELNQESEETLSESSGTNYQLNSAEKKIWDITEPALREVITIVMSHHHGPQWIDIVEREHTEIQNIFRGCRKERQAHQNSLPGEDNELYDLINFTKPADLFDIILHDDIWQYFRKFFGKNDPQHDCDWTNYWTLRSDFIRKRFRNPASHGNESMIRNHERDTFRGYCGEILEICGKIKDSFETATAVEGVVSEDQRKLHQNESVQEELQPGTVSAVNLSKAYFRIQPSTQQADHPMGIFAEISDFQNSNTIEVGNNVKFRIVSTDNGLRARNVVLVEGEQ